MCILLTLASGPTWCVVIGAIQMHEVHESGLSADLGGQRLRKLIREAELGVANLKGSGGGATQLLRTLDRIDDLLVELDSTGMDLRPERTRLHTVEGYLKGKGSKVLWQLRRNGGLAAARRAQPSLPPRSRWWWYLDDIRRRELLGSARKWAITSLIVGVVLVAAYFAYERFLAPSPEEQLKQALVLEAESSLSKGEFEASLSQYEAALAVDPKDPELHVWAGVLSERVDQNAKAGGHYAEAQRLLGDRARFLIVRANAHLRTGALNQAAQDAEESMALNPKAAEPHLVLGSVYEARGDVPGAMQEYTLTATLADEAGQDVLHVIAKMRTAMLLQGGAPMQQ